MYHKISAIVCGAGSSEEPLNLSLDDSAFVTSPRFPRFYPIDTFVVWDVEAVDPQAQIVITFVHFNVSPLFLWSNIARVRWNKKIPLPFNL